LRACNKKQSHVQAKKIYIVMFMLLIVLLVLLVCPFED
jgi:hypothetical protein